MTDRETITLDKQLFDQALEHLRPGTSAGPEGVPYAVGLLTASATLAPSPGVTSSPGEKEITWWRNEAHRLSAAIEAAGFRMENGVDSVWRLVRVKAPPRTEPVPPTDHGA